MIAGSKLLQFETFERWKNDCLLFHFCLKIIKYFSTILVQSPNLKLFHFEKWKNDCLLFHFFLEIIKYFSIFNFSKLFQFKRWKNDCSLFHFCACLKIVKYFPIISLFFKSCRKERRGKIKKKYFPIIASANCSNSKDGRIIALSFLPENSKVLFYHFVNFPNCVERKGEEK